LNPEIIPLIRNADKIVINPGNLYCSVIPNLLVSGLCDAIRRSKAKKIYVCNLMTKLGHTDGFTVVDFLDKIESHLGRRSIDFVVYNQQQPEESLLRRYARQGEYPVELGDTGKHKQVEFVGAKLLSKTVPVQKKGDPIKRTLIRHDSAKLAKIIYGL
jgi:uncharacterized cofD-like protein